MYNHKGDVLYRLFYVDGRCEDEETHYYPSGKISFRACLSNGDLHGERISIDYAGNIIYHEVYINGVFHANYEDLTEIDKFELSLKYGDIFLKPLPNT